MITAGLLTVPGSPQSLKQQKEVTLLPTLKQTQSDGDTMR